MRVTSLLLAAGFALFANAQTNTGVVTPTPTQDPASAAQNSAQAEMVRCIEACPDGDVSCTSKCIAVPNPSEDMVNDTNTCVAACPQGEGSPEETKAYGDCIQKCIGDHYFTASAGSAPKPTATDANGNPAGTDGSSNEQVDATDSAGAPAATASKGAAAVVKGASGVVGAVAGLVAFMAV